ncbi:hypothetical protein BDN70DRAFT_993612 [Pholiota conissans]|uniref:F-box domain-containing protein n=1 Tax=Pholiota conissans TaxID=109636 RepID=A0A9P5Z2T6_9AGAR|nr:hypothetical protein BDN70DRAFT_993612 [Pholiota conissans]
MSALFTLKGMSHTLISKVPDDVLREIFILCLPQFPLSNAQPDTQTAPMLLCQVCSSWRAVALAFPTLWARLTCTILEEIWISPTQPRWKVRRDHFEFVRWWRRNQGSMAPFLTFDSERVEPTMASSNVISLSVAIPFFLEDVTSAQYLDLDLSLWKQVIQAMKDGTQIVFPNLHTLVNFNWGAKERLGNEGALHDFNATPSPWSLLTHIAFQMVEIPLKSWYFFIRAFPDLQWGRFAIYIVDGTNHVKPDIFTHARLSALFISYKDTSNTGQEQPINVLLAGLYLPALRLLSLHSISESRRDSRVTSEISAVLKSTPNLTTLCLPSRFLGYGSYTYDANIKVAASIWEHASHIVHLELVFPGGLKKSDAKPMLDHFMKDIFALDNRWLDLGNPKCPIRRITIHDSESSLGVGAVKKFMGWCSRERLKKIPNVDFQLSRDPSSNEKADEKWKEWGGAALQLRNQLRNEILEKDLNKEASSSHHNDRSSAVQTFGNSRRFAADVRNRTQQSALQQRGYTSAFFNLGFLQLSWRSFSLSMSLTGPINGVPYDILREIIIKCLPQYALDNPRQPNLQVASMLLCHAEFRILGISSESEPRIDFEITSTSPQVEGGDAWKEWGA